MRITEATLDKLEEIASIENSSFTDPWSKTSLAEAINSENIKVYAVLDESDYVVAFSCLLIIDYEAEILNIAVSEKFRNKGIGKSLAEHMIGVCKSKDADSIYLEVRDSNVAARLLYSKLGFTELGTRKKYYSNPAEDAILMRLSLTDD